MLAYTIVWNARFGRSIPKTMSPLSLLDVTLQPRKGSRKTKAGESRVELTRAEQASSPADALAHGLDRIRVAAASSEIVFNCFCRLEGEPKIIGPSPINMGQASVTGGAFLKQIPLSNGDARNASTASTTWAPPSLVPDAKERIGYAFRWFSKAVRNTDPLDALMEAWIAIELLVKEGQKSGGNKPLLKTFAIPYVCKLFPNESPMGIQHLLREIYDAERNPIIHGGNPQLEIIQRSPEAIALARAILDGELGLPVDVESKAVAAIARAYSAHNAGCNFPTPCKP
jgi:hypothetical protein